MLVPEFVEQLSDAFDDVLLSDQNLSLYALVDCAFDYLQPHTKHSTWKNQAIALYENSQFEGLINASPNLLLFPKDAESRRQLIRSISSASSGKPMISFIASSLPLNALADTFKPFLELCTDDEQGFILRIADTRILPALDSILSKEMIAGWRKGISYWWLPSREGVLTALPKYYMEDKNFDPKQRTLTLQKKPFNSLIDAGENDAILDAIFDQNPDLLMDIRPSDAYLIVQFLKEKVAEFCIHSFPDIVMFYTTAFATSPHFYMQRDFNSVLRSGAWAKGKLGEAFAAIDDVAWQAVTSMSKVIQTEVAEKN